MEKKAIHEELITIQNKIKDLKKDFFEKKKIKEEFFTQGEELSEQINSLYQDVKKIEEENNLDDINKELEKHKSEYDSIKEEYNKLKALFEETLESKKRASKTHNDTTSKSHDNSKPKRISPEKAQKELKALEHKVQTQVLSLEKEAELSREITELKDIALKHSNVTKVETSEDSDEFKKLKKDYYDTRKKFNVIEKKIRSLYKQIRLISKDKKQKYKEIDTLRESKKEAFNQFREHKKSYVELSKELKDLFKEEEKILEDLGEDAPVKKKKDFRNSNNNAKRQKEVEDQLMKKGMTLTTDDLISLQKRN